MHKIIDDDDIFELSIFNDSEVFDVVAIVGFHAVSSVKKALNYFFILVQVVDNDWGVVLCARGKDVDVLKFWHLLQELVTVRTDVEMELQAMLLDLDLATFEFSTARKLCMDQGLV